jgi:hypothetical protein
MGFRVQGITPDSEVETADKEDAEEDLGFIFPI